VIVIFGAKVSRFGPSIRKPQGPMSNGDAVQRCTLRGNLYNNDVKSFHSEERAIGGGNMSKDALRKLLGNLN
jgi:hypothetical protein